MIKPSVIQTRNFLFFEQEFLSASPRRRVALRLSRATLRNIRANLAIALTLKVAFVALAAAGVATLWMAVLADTGASLIVTANSLRLLRIR